MLVNYTLPPKGDRVVYKSLSALAHKRAKTKLTNVIEMNKTADVQIGRYSRQSIVIKYPKSYLSRSKSKEKPVRRIESNIVWCPTERSMVCIYGYSIMSFGFWTACSSLIHARASDPITKTVQFKLPYERVRPSKHTPYDHKFSFSVQWKCNDDCKTYTTSA